MDSYETQNHKVEILDPEGKVVYSHDNVTAPEWWSHQAVKIFSSKFFTPEESTPEEVFARVMSVLKGNLDEDTFTAVSDYLIKQEALFNSPVMFNFGVHDNPQASACFIIGIGDSMEEISEALSTCFTIFKYGSGAGINFSALRGSSEKLAGSDGVASGPISFIRPFDKVAGVIKSGGKCLAAEQPIWTTEGIKRAEDLAGKSFITMAYDAQLGRVAARRATAWKEGYKRIVEVETDKGTFHVSCDHPFMLNGEIICKAEELKPGMSLMPLSVHYSQEYIVASLHDGLKGRMAIHRLIAIDVMGMDPKLHVHHKNGNRIDNSESNLDMISHSKHASDHGKERALSGSHVFQSEEFKNAGHSAGSKNGMHKDSRFWDSEDSIEYRKMKSKELLDRGNASEIQKLSVKKHMLNTAYKLINEDHSEVSTFDKYLKARKVTGKKSIDKITKSIERHFGTYDIFYKELRSQNHKVISVKYLRDDDVYKVNVENENEETHDFFDGHNFPLAKIGSEGSSLVGQFLFTSNTRRAAFASGLDTSHPNIFEFVTMKPKEEAKAKILAAHGYGDGMDSESYTTVDFQNLNPMVTADDKFMIAVRDDKSYDLINRNNGEIAETIQARDLLHTIAVSSHDSGDPGLQFTDTMNRGHSVPSAGRINGSNPCLAGDTLITLKDGDVPIKDLDGKTGLIRHSDGWEKAKFFKTGHKPVYRVVTSNDRYVNCTADHQWYIGKDDGWVEARHTISLYVRDYDNDGLMHRYPRIDSIEYIGEQDVYDFTILDKTKEPAAIINGFKLHNCSEFLFIDDSACNLAAINLLKTLHMKGEEYFIKAIRRMIRTMDAIIDVSSYPSEKIRANSIKYRPLGLGYGNLHALLMMEGMAYDSNEGRERAKEITKMMTYHALLESQALAEEFGHNMSDQEQEEMFSFWVDYYPDLPKKEFRNATLTLLAPLGTTGFAMDLDSFGIEPIVAIKYKKNLAGGGYIYIYPRCVVDAISNITSFSRAEASAELNDDSNKGKSIDEIFDIDTGKLFQTAMGDNIVSIDGHVKMMAAVQPYLSGAISKTVNLPNETTVEEIEALYIQAWELGLKAIAIYRAGSKMTEPLSVETKAKPADLQPTRERLPDTKEAVNHRFDIMGHVGYLSMSKYPDGRMGELFVSLAKEGSSLSGLIDAMAIAVSIGLQHRIPVETFIRKLKNLSFSPSGMTTNEDIQHCQSIPDYIARFMESKFCEKPLEITSKKEVLCTNETGGDTPICPNCGNLTQRRGAHCYLCPTCGDEGCSGI